MNLEVKSWIIEKLRINEIWEEWLKTLLDIQKDTWSFFIWEYVSCLNCGKINSKKDIYSKKDKSYSKKTVTELEEEYWIDNIKCTCCWWSTKFLRWNWINNDMERQLFDSVDSYVVVLKNKVWKIIWFSYAYIDKLSRIYEKEFSATFKPELLKKYNIMRNELMISIPWTCMEERIINPEDIFSLLTSLAMSIDNKYSKCIWVFEAIVWTSTYNFFKKMWWRSLDLLETWKELYKKDLKNAIEVSDIIVHPWVVDIYKAFYWKSIVDALKWIRK